MTTEAHVDHVPDTWAFAYQTRTQLRARANAGAILVIPLGAVEQHGPHLPVWTDSLVASTIARRAAATLDGDPDVLVTPTACFGSSDHHLPFGGTLSLSHRTFFNVVVDLGRSAGRSGFHRIMFCNGHGGNDELMQAAARDLALNQGLRVASVSWWKLIESQAKEHEVASTFARIPGHAGALETSLMRHLTPHLVSSAPGPQPTVANLSSRIDLPDALLATDGYTDSPGQASAEVGETILQWAVSAFADEVLHFDRVTRTSADAPESRVRA